jgi:sulfur-carrier protein adenylyltransferase/sulfurtransferase
MNRYVRQTILPGVGETGQSRLAAAHILIVGAGGLGVPALQYLAGAGVGKITLVDPDTVAEHNLHRQPLYRMGDIGRPKVQVAAEALKALNPETEIVSVPDWFEPANAPSLLDGVSLALDCADSFAVSYALSDACVEARLPLISASALGFEGYVGAYCGGAPSLRAVFPDLPERAASCETAGVLGPVVGMLGTIEAQMALSLLLGLEPSPLGRLVSFDARTWRFGGFSFSTASEPADPLLRFIGPSQITPDDMAIDLRGPDEAPELAVPHAMRIGLDALDDLASPKPNQRLVLCCRTGLRAWRAAKIVQGRWPGDVALVAMGNR